MLGVGRQLPIGDLLGRILRRLPLFLAIAVDVGVGQYPVEPGLEIVDPYLKSYQDEEDEEDEEADCLEYIDNTDKIIYLLYRRYRRM